MPSDTRKTFGSSDTEVVGRNNITFKDLVLRNEHEVIKVDGKIFIQLKKTTRISKVCF